jgi:hypothetical protein
LVRLAQLRYLLDSAQVTPELRWTSNVSAER